MLAVIYCININYKLLIFTQWDLCAVGSTAGASQNLRSGTQVITKSLSKTPVISKFQLHLTLFIILRSPTELDRRLGYPIDRSIDCACLKSAVNNLHKRSETLTSAPAYTEGVAFLHNVVTPTSEAGGLCENPPRASWEPPLSNHQLLKSIYQFVSTSLSLCKMTSLHTQNTAFIFYDEDFALEDYSDYSHGFCSLEVENLFSWFNLSLLCKETRVTDNIYSFLELTLLLMSWIII